MDRVRTLVWSIVKCKDARILLAISWLFGEYFHSRRPVVWLTLPSLQRLLDPPGSAYRSETGGLMEALRRLTPERS